MLVTLLGSSARVDALGDILVHGTYGYVIVDYDVRYYARLSLSGQDSAVICWMSVVRLT
jgi:RNA-binding protein YlmH